MELGGLRTDRERVFLLSTTHGGETPGLAAAIATIDVYESEPVIEHLYRQGERLAAGLRGGFADTATACPTTWLPSAGSHATCSSPRTIPRDTRRSRIARCSCRRPCAGAC